MASIVVEKVTQLDEQLKTFFDDENRGRLRPDRAGNALSSIESMLSEHRAAGRIIETEWRSLPEGAVRLERVTEPTNLSSMAENIVLREPAEYFEEVEVCEEAPQTTAEKMAKAIASGDTTLFAARDATTGEVVATVVLAKGKSDWGCTR